MAEFSDTHVRAKKGRTGPIDLKSGAHHRIVVIRPEFHRVEFPCLQYRDGSAVAVPREANGWLHPLWGAIESLHDLKSRPERELCVVGHAAPGEADADALSADRAEGMHAVLTKNKDVWVGIAVRRGSLEDVTSYLHYLYAYRGFSCECVSPSAEPTAETEAAVHAFQSDYNLKFDATIEVDGVCGEQTLGAVFDTLRREFEGWLVQEELAETDIRLSETAPHFGVGARLFNWRLLPEPVSNDNRRVVDFISHDPDDLDGVWPSAESLYLDSLALIDQSAPPYAHEYWAGAVRVWLDPDHDGDDLPPGIVMRLLGDGYQADLPLADATEDARHHLCLTFENVPMLPRYDLWLDPHGEGTFHQPLLLGVGWQALRRGCREGMHAPGQGGDPVPPVPVQSAKEGDDELEIHSVEESCFEGVEVEDGLY